VRSQRSTRPAPLPLLAAVTVLGATALAAAPASSTQETATDLRKWHDGPVRYLLDHDERKVFRALDTDVERALFIERFWARRDPSPETLTNEYRQLFWERVQQANDSFVDSSKPGWLTDRGKIHILYGPPTETQEDLHLETRGLPEGGRGVIRWIYEGRPGGRTDLDAIVVVPFEREPSGEYRLSYDPHLASVFFDAKRYEEMGTTARYLERLAPESRLAVMLDLGKLQEVPPQEQVLLERVETVESYRARPLVASVLRYVHGESGLPLAVVTIDLEGLDEDVSPSVLGRFTPRDATQHPRLLGESSFRIEDVDGRRIAEGRSELSPGVWDLTVLVIDPGTADTAIHRSVVDVSASSGGFRSSDVTLALSIESLRYAALSSHDEPFHIGPFRVIPRFDARLVRGEAAAVFYELYGGTAPYRVSYQVEGHDLDGSWVELGQPSISEQAGVAQAWEVTTGERWPLGSYRVRIGVTDALGRSIEELVPFELVESQHPRTP
jgi:GWxTD domain-containing protein